MKDLLLFDTMITPGSITFIDRPLLFIALPGGIGTMYRFTHPNVPLSNHLEAP